MGREIFCKKFKYCLQRDAASEKKIKSCISHSLEQFKSSTRNTDRTETHLVHALTNSSYNASKLGVRDLGLSGHELIFCKKTKISQS